MVMKHPTMGSQSITRRGFLKLGALGLTAAFGFVYLPSRRIYHALDKASLFDLIHGFKNAVNHLEALPVNQQGRVLEPSIEVYASPSFAGNQVNTYYLDTVLSITGVTIGKSEDSFNMVWYQVGGEGFVHSGVLQPVFTVTNPVASHIPPDGTLAEVTVPFTDAHWDPGRDEPVAYRYYYATTHWVVELVQDLNGNPWYGVKDDKWEYTYYVLAQHLRIFPAEELNPISTDVPFYEKRIEVHIPQQVMIAYEYNQPVFMARIASGAIFSNGDYSTPTGRHMTFHKRASRHMARGNLAANGYDLPGVPWNSYITEEGVAFHGTYWHNNFGHPRSHGCINLTPQASKWVYLWTKPDVPPEIEGIYEKTGTTVDIIG
jgi:lipoprotein-anchoring transpeptidase ErfK/SrfK